MNDPYRSVTLANGTELNCRVPIIATGASLRTLDVPGTEAVTGAGVYYGAAITEAAYYKGERVFVVGGANSAGQGAMFFSRYASKVTMLVRGSGLSKGKPQYLVDQIDNTENIEVCLRRSVIEVKGRDRLEGLVIQNNDTNETHSCWRQMCQVSLPQVMCGKVLSGGWLRQWDKGQRPLALSINI